MATIITHPILAATLGRVLRIPRKVIIAGAVLSCLPDADFIAFYTPLTDWHWLGHRGFTHSLLFSVVFACLLAALFFRDTVRGSGMWWRSVAFLSVCGASHGILDAFTSGGAGIAFLWPFSEARFVAPWRPIQVSPVGLDFFSMEGLEVLASEFRWVWIPCLAVLGLEMLWRQWRAPLVQRNQA